MVLLVLALIWAAALLPPFIRSRMEGSPADSVGRFKRHLRILQSTSPAANSLATAQEPESGVSMPAVWANEARRLRGMRRRRQIALGLLIAMGVTFLIGLIPSMHALLIFNVVIDLMFVGYVALLARLRAIETERQMAAHFARLRQMQRTEEAAITKEHPIVADVL